MILILIAIVQGLTEFLPVSSSGHEALIDHFSDSVDTTRAFAVTVHLGTLLAVLIWYRKLLFSIARRLAERSVLNLLIKLAVATIPGVLMGLVVAQLDIVFSAWLTVVALAVGGVLFVWFDRDYTNPGSKGELSIEACNHIGLKQFGLIGLAQALAIVPGVSRSGSTILASSALGIDRLRAIDVSFLLSIPVISGAGFYELVLSDSEFVIDGVVVASFLIAFVVGLAAIALCRNWVVRYGLQPFGYYRLALAAVVAGLLLL